MCSAIMMNGSLQVTKCVFKVFMHMYTLFFKEKHPSVPASDR